jgi:hypothetical protein
MTILRLALATALCLCAASSPAAAKPKIVANGDLPTKRYDLGAPPSKAWTRDAFVRDTLPIRTMPKGCSRTNARCRQSRNCARSAF